MTNTEINRANYHCRVGSIEFRLSEFNKQYEIVQWHPNKEYHAQERLKKEGYSLMKDGSMVSPSSPEIHSTVRYDGSCFENKENCMVLAFVKFHNGEFDLHTVGDRPWTLDESGTNDFKAVLEFVKSICIEMPNSK